MATGIGTLVAVVQQDLIGKIAHAGKDNEDITPRLLGPHGFPAMPAFHRRKRAMRETVSVMTAWLRISAASHRLVARNGLWSDDGSTEQAPVDTKPQPPSGFIARKAARSSGAALVVPDARGT